MNKNAEGLDYRMQELKSSIVTAESRGVGDNEFHDQLQENGSHFIVLSTHSYISITHSSRNPQQSPLLLIIASIEIWSTPMMN